MSRASNDHDDPRLRRRLKLAYGGTPPRHLTARVEELARPLPREAAGAGLRSAPVWREMVAPAAGIALLAGLLVGLWPLLHAATSGGAPPAPTAPLRALPGLPLLGEALRALVVPLLLAWCFELSRGAPLLRRFLR